MKVEYDFKKIEEKWQKVWEEREEYQTKEESDKEKYYVLEQFPYPSGNLHMGHVRVYAIGDVIARVARTKGYNTLHPIGWDAFGLPAENAAFKHGVHPRDWTKSNIKNMKEQFKLLGLSYDWGREISTANENYYKFTQMIFIKLFEHNLAYKKKSLVNWCPSCKTVLANEQVATGKCERCSAIVAKKDLEQWFFKITDYAEELIDDLATLPNWPKKVKQMQINWIGKSKGVEVNFKFKDKKLPKLLKIEDYITVYTTRPETLYGVTYIAVAPEHEFLKKLLSSPEMDVELKKQCVNFIESCSSANEIERTSKNTEKIGIWTGIYLINPIDNSEVPLYVTNYVILNYATGFVMGVPAHDERDFDFAKKYNLPMKYVIENNKENKETTQTEDGVLINSGKFNGLCCKKAAKQISEHVKQSGFGSPKINYKLRDWLISRQRYWGAPIPIIYCKKCGIVCEKEENLPVRLPKELDFTSFDSPLASYEKFINTLCPKCRAPSRREVDTMDTFVCSSWYYLRYCDRNNEKQPFLREKTDKWMPIDKYVGGIEHAVLHLLYSRFLMKFFYKIGLVSQKEPFPNLVAQGMVLKNHAKMSKSLGNIVSLDKTRDKYGADTLRLFIMFAAPYESDLEWNDNAVMGVKRFLERVWRIVNYFKFWILKDYEPNGKITTENLTDQDKALFECLNSSLKNIKNDINKLSFNTAISRSMELCNALYKYKENMPDFYNAELLSKTILSLIIVISPFCPHMTSELWEILKRPENLTYVAFPEHEETFTLSKEIEFIVEVNGKIKEKLKMPSGSNQEDLKNVALSSEKIKKSLNNKSLKKIIFVKEKLINFVTDQ